MAELKSRESKLREKILPLLEREVQVDGKTVSRQERETLSFGKTLIPYLKKLGYNNYIVEAVDEKKLKEDIAASKELKKVMASKTISKYSWAVIVK